MARISAEERREQFVRAAIEIMAAEGLEAATTRRIADHAGAPQARFHYAFRDKDELLVAVVEELANRFQKLMDASVNPERGLSATLRAMIESFWEHAVGDEGLQLMQYELAVHTRRKPGLEWLAERQYELLLTAVVERLDQAAEASGTPADTAALARFLVALGDGQLLQYQALRQPGAKERDIDLTHRLALTLAGLDRKA
ncbi:hypothetical protein GCM10010269_79070 [Streptomyces humidus]|uniref:HTH tetR-type domain-containing protein n=1 Tax=Streptomyces humidus TaxID=52259 RepID=A0A918LBR3_9ACTN|nr:TetR family transcriptional regulator [Streptomyces humidus]GGS28526.1 hypothetical protein GCM10010269_79070 [Streptomyces humidus]